MPEKDGIMIGEKNGLEIWKECLCLYNHSTDHTPDNNLFLSPLMIAGL